MWEEAGQELGIGAPGLAKGTPMRRVEEKAAEEEAERTVGGIAALHPGLDRLAGERS
jgi:hypothetical protein